MAVKPKNYKLTATSVDILNAIRNSASTNYRDYVPAADPSQDSIREIGAIIMDFPGLQNEFLSALVNRIGRVLISSKMYSNPWAVFKKGLLEFGETVEDIFVNIAKPFEYDPAVAESKIFARETPDVRSAFHVLNYQKFYKTTIQQEQLRQAFLSWEGITDLIAKIIDSMYTAANYDEFQVMKYMLDLHIINGQIKTELVNPYTSAANAQQTVSHFKGISNKLTFMSTEYNLAGVNTFSNKEDQYLILTADLDAAYDVDVLASAFNMDKAEFMGHRVLVDSFDTLDTKRLEQLFKGDETFHKFTEDELASLKKVQAVLVDKDYFMIFDNLQNFTEQYNGEGLYWNYWYHIWKTFSVSPFANAVVFTESVPSVTSVTVTPGTVTVNKGQTVNFKADVVTEGFAPKAVIWSIDKTDKASINIYGELKVEPDFADTKITVTATSVFDDSKKGTATVTVSE